MRSRLNANMAQAQAQKKEEVHLSYACACAYITLVHTYVFLCLRRTCEPAFIGPVLYFGDSGFWYSGFQFRYSGIPAFQLLAQLPHVARCR